MDGRTLRHGGRIAAAQPAVTSDHGESFGEHGALDHRVSLHPEVLSVPLVVAALGRLPAGLRVRGAVRLQDLHPTLLDLPGMERAPESLVRRVEGKPALTPVVSAAWPDPIWAEPARAAELRLAAPPRIGQGDQPVATVPLEIPARVADQLRRLGYAH